MARAKKASRILSDAEKRLAGMKVVNAELSFGDGISVPDLETKIINFRTTLAAYNQKLSEVDDIYEDVLDTEQDLYKLSSKLLSGVGLKYGRDSSEYETVGGSRLGKRRRRSSVETEAAPPENDTASNPQQENPQQENLQQENPQKENPQKEKVTA